MARVFAALTTGDEIVRWWGSAESYRTESWVSDLRVGGKWRATGRGADGNAFSVEGEFLELDPPHKLVHTWVAAWDHDHVTTVTIRLHELDGVTRVTLRHDGFAGRPAVCADHTNGWQAVLGFLASYVVPKPSVNGSAVNAPNAPTKKFFLARLHGPRPSFPADITDAERVMMQEHGRYWRAHLGDGKVIVFGPVADPKGAWGLGVLAVADEAEAHAFQAGDPVIRAQCGFRYELIPMLAAISRD